jgi:hypothetical protein
VKKPASSLRFSTAQVILLLFTTLPGMTGVAVFSFFALQDWNQLRHDYSYFIALIERSAALEALFVAEAQQNVHRVNLMADGVWALLSAILVAIGLHGACLPRR